MIIPSYSIFDMKYVNVVQARAREAKARGQDVEREREQANSGVK